MNLQQRYMQQALEHVLPLAGEDDALKTAYGALCHQLPILVLTHGLPLTAAFVDAKAIGTAPRAEAFARIRTHLIATLDEQSEATSLSSLLAGRNSAAMQMLDTTTILDAWVFYKRFAVSLLGVQAGDDLSDTETVQP